MATPGRIALVGSAYFALGGPVAALGPSGVYAALGVILVLLAGCLALALSLPDRIFAPQPSSQAA